MQKNHLQIPHQHNSDISYFVRHLFLLLHSRGCIFVEISGLVFRSVHFQQQRSNAGMTHFMSPYLEFLHHRFQYAGMSLAVNNFGVVFLTCSLYGFLCIALYLKVRRTSSAATFRSHKSVSIASNRSTQFVLGNHLLLTVV